MSTVLSKSEQQLLHYVQAGIPVVPRPFEQLGKELQMGESHVLKYLLDWKEKGVVRWLGAIFSTRSLGYQSTLVAMSLPPEKIEIAADTINQHLGVTHNYQREYDFNLWFTLAVAPQEDMEAHIERLAQTSGAQKWINLPVVRTYKISLILPVAEEESLPQSFNSGSSEDHVYFLSDEEKGLVKVLQEDWPIASNPYALLAGEWGSSEEELIDKVNAWKNLGIIRRIAAILRHHEAGFKINWMAAWQVPQDKLDFAGEQAARNPLVSHCYQRIINSQWPYQLFTMIHARDEDEAKKTVEELCRIIEPFDYKILPTVREFKKTRLKLFL